MSDYCFEEHLCGEGLKDGNLQHMNKQSVELRNNRNGLKVKEWEFLLTDGKIVSILFYNEEGNA